MYHQKVTIYDLVNLWSRCEKLVEISDNLLRYHQVSVVHTHLYISMLIDVCGLSGVLNPIDVKRSTRICDIAAMLLLGCRDTSTPPYDMYLNVMVKDGVYSVSDDDIISIFLQQPKIKPAQ